MDRRTFLGTLAGGLLATPLAAEGQQAGGFRKAFAAIVREHLPVLGVLVPAEPDSPTEPHLSAFRQALHDLGYVDGQTVAVEYRYAHGKADLYPELVAQLVRLKVDLMVVGSGTPTLAAKRATHSIPIVGVGMSGDPVGIGLVASLARPGGNVTGLSFLTGGTHYGKWMEQLKEAAPRISRVGFLHDARNPANPLNALFLNDLQTAAHAFGLKVQVLEVRELHEFDRVMATMSRQPGGSLALTAEPLFVAQPSRITELAAKHRLPAIYGARVFVDAGGLMSYGPSLADLWRRAATYVDRILKGGVAPVWWRVNCFRDPHGTNTEGDTDIAPPWSIVDPEGTVRFHLPCERSKSMGDR